MASFCCGSLNIVHYQFAGFQVLAFLARPQSVAGIFGKEAALFCASGTMTNQIAIKVSTSPRDEVICDQN